MNLIKDKIPVLGLDIVERRSSFRPEITRSGNGQKPECGGIYSLVVQYRLDNCILRNEFIIENNFVHGIIKASNSELTDLKS